MNPIIKFLITKIKTLSIIAEKIRVHEKRTGTEFRSNPFTDQDGCSAFSISRYDDGDSWSVAVVESREKADELITVLRAATESARADQIAAMEHEFLLALSTVLLGGHNDN